MVARPLANLSILVLLERHIAGIAIETIHIAEIEGDVGARDCNDEVVKYNLKAGPTAEMPLDEADNDIYRASGHEKEPFGKYLRILTPHLITFRYYRSRHRQIRSSRNRAVHSRPKVYENDTLESDWKPPCNFLSLDS
ncbi:uncharacterized protein BDR25DRAFT_318393 [Lindgomyces ingoldianus]|uniref:Uncharacterized protein n=1 Tax=Lindgomyces ingoldianus TaxID=673940 RepID=A0ACB6QGP7_9PLEO|nr:uncharacterized protein BDR25DRAFT_318393 [Lindgomyces ingoldianus]KAF2465537.1 hypothetical protein BDR25DRAFT_318393 [Lindgomyces ingoldianus]